jgi:hypothetical protein
MLCNLQTCTQISTTVTSFILWMLRQFQFYSMPVMLIKFSLYGSHFVLLQYFCWLCKWKYYYYTINWIQKWRWEIFNVAYHEKCKTVVFYNYETILCHSRVCDAYENVYYTLLSVHLKIFLTLFTATIPWKCQNTTEVCLLVLPHSNLTIT